MNSADPRDPLGLAADAPLLAAWLTWMEQAESGRLLPMSTPGHKQRYDLVGTVVAGDAPLYGALDAIKHADRLRADGEARAAALWGADEAGVPLIVDQAWAAYLGFHPDLPAHAIAAGADGLVTSAHKTLPAYTQGAVMLARTERLDRARLERAFDATHTTSPAGSILASIDAARALLARDGERLCGRLLRGLAAARKRLREVPGLDVLDGP